MDTAKYTKHLLEIAQKNHRDVNDALNGFLDYLIETFDVENLQKFDMNYENVFLDAKEKNEDYFALMVNWFAEVTMAMEKGGYLDFFGSMYEETWKGKGKASALGQFYTPEHLCTLMAEITASDTNGRYNDCACGSGRTMLAAYAKADKTKFKWFDAGDIDYVSCKMCALNFMAHGMIGEVKQQNALTLETPIVKYIINEVRYPFPTKMYSIRRVYPSRIKAEEKKETVKKVDEPVINKEQEKPKHKEPIQLSLF